MDKLTLVLALIGIGLGAYAAFGTPHDGDGAYDATSPDATGEFASLRAEMAALRATIGGPAMHANGTLGGVSGTLSGRGTTPLPAGIEARFEAHEKRMAEVEAKADAASKKGKDALDTSSFSFMGKSRVLANLDMAEKELKLDSGQRAQFERVIEGTKAELDRLFDTPDDNGKTLRELMNPPPIDLDGGTGKDLTVQLFGNFGKLWKFQRQKVPGTNETYAEAERRIRGAGKRDARGHLSEEQAKKWDNSHTDSLFGSYQAGASLIILGENSAELPLPGK